jgi:hypothetical protein
LFEEGLQRQGIREPLRLHAVAESLQQSPSADELLVYRIREGRNTCEFFVGNRGLHAGLDQMQRDRGDRECRGQYHRRDTHAEPRVQADADAPKTR